MASAADCPSKFDLIINGQGYIFDASFDPSVVYRTQKASYGYTPTFIERSNVQGDYGDNQQDFWLTATQRDWSLGEGQVHFRSTDDQSSRRYFVATNVESNIEGQVTMAFKAVSTVTPGVLALRGAGSSVSDVAYTSTSTNLIRINADGTQTDLGAHGAGGFVTAYATDGANLFLSGAGCTSTRKLSSAGAFSTFSSTPFEALAFNNNTLYGANAGNLESMTTAGVASVQFTFKDAVGTALADPSILMLTPFGGSIAVLKTENPTGLYTWNGALAVTKIADFPGNFTPQGLCVSLGVIYVIGLEKVGSQQRVVVYSSDGGSNLGLIYRSPAPGAAVSGCAICSFGLGFAFYDPITLSLRVYDAVTTALSSVCSITPNTTPYLAASNKFVLLTNELSTSNAWPVPTASTTTATVTTSRFDFESSLPKLLSGVTVLFDPATDGDGGSVGVSYYTTNAASPTSLNSSATSGTEILFPPNTQSTDVGLVITLNKGTSTFGPLLKRVFVRAAPIQRTFRRGSYILDLTGNRNNVTGKPNLVALRDGTSHTKDGQDMANDLVTAVTLGSPVSITDRFGTFTGIVEPDQFELHEMRSNYGRGEFRALVTVRQT